MKQFLKEIAFIALNAGVEILKVYNSDFEVESKNDSSPITLADKNAHKIIEEGLDKTPYPILSEEGREIAFEERKNWERFWMVDPLDGTKEFVKRNGEFTVNIALIENGKAIMGAIYVPVSGVMYLGAKGLGSFKIENFHSVSKSDFEKYLSIEKQMPKKIERPYTMVVSRSHMSAETMDFMETLKQQHESVEVISVGSSLKLCMLAEGRADIYPRFAPTMEWDTAAGHAILESARGSLIDWTTKENMKYNRENLTNNWFLAKA